MRRSIAWVVLLCVLLGANVCLAQGGSADPPVVVTETSSELGAEAPPVDVLGVLGESYYFKVEPVGWFMQIDGSVKIVDNGIGDQLGLDDDLGIEDSQTVPGLKAELRFWEVHKLRFETLFFEVDGTRQTVGETIRFAGKTFDLSAGIEAEAEINYFEFGYEFDFLQFDRGYVGAIVEAKVLYAEVEVKGFVSQNNTLISEEESQLLVLPLPAVGLAAKFYPHERVAIGAEMTGIYAGTYGNYFDLDVLVGVDIIENVGLAAGLKWLHIETKYDDNEGRLDLWGPYISAVIRF